MHTSSNSQLLRVADITVAHSTPPTRLPRRTKFTLATDGSYVLFVQTGDHQSGSSSESLSLVLHDLQAKKAHSMPLPCKPQQLCPETFCRAPRTSALLIALVRDLEKRSPEAKPPVHQSARTAKVPKASMPTAAADLRQTVQSAAPMLQSPGFYEAPFPVPDQKKHRNSRFSFTRKSTVRRSPCTISMNRVSKTRPEDSR